jgi:hypothetical protein
MTSQACNILSIVFWEKQKAGLPALNLVSKILTQAAENRPPPDETKNDSNMQLLSQSQ